MLESYNNHKGKLISSPKKEPNYQCVAELVHSLSFKVAFPPLAVCLFFCLCESWKVRSHSFAITYINNADNASVVIYYTSSDLLVLLIL